MELHDSKIVAWTLADGRLVIRLDAYVHVSLGRPGVDAGTGWEQRVELVLEGAVLGVATAEAPLWITEGMVATAAGELALLPVPLELGGPVRLDLAGAGGRLAATGSAMSLSPAGEPRFVERVSGAPAG